MEGLEETSIPERQLSIKARVTTKDRTTPPGECSAWHASVGLNA
jgi:hypothetical protein